MIQPATGADGDYLDAVRRLRGAYGEVVRALPWLDASVWEDEEPAFGAFASDCALPGVKAVHAEPAVIGKLEALKAQHGGVLLRYDPARSGALEALGDLFSQMVRVGAPLVVLHTDVEFEQIGQLAERWPALPIIVESGPLKILYHLTELEALLAEQSNVYLCTYNLCNWLGLERLCAKGFGQRLLFASHRPRYSPHAVMGPIAMGRLRWESKCDLAGNNLRRLLGEPAIEPGEVPFAAPEPFVVDAHGHSGATGRFPVPDEQFAPQDWLEFMDFCGIERLYVCPLAAIQREDEHAAELTADLRAAAPERFSYFEVFRPRGATGGKERIQRSLDDPACVGIKIHPSFHEVEADDLAYAAVYELAASRGATILTHSWEVSETNPVQCMSHPGRFRRHLEDHPEVRLVLGHAGGRPGAAEDVIALCQEFPEVRVDLAGDYYDNGLVEFLVDHIGADRVIFGSDVNWIDPRANLGPVLGSDLPDDIVLKILRTNALATYARPNITSAEGRESPLP